MTKLNQRFNGDLAVQLPPLVRVGASRPAFRSKAVLMALILAAAISAVIGVFGLFQPDSSAATRSWSLSIDEISKTIDTQSLPVQQVENSI